MHTDKSNGETLEFTTRKEVDLTIEDVPKLELVDHVVEVVHLRAGANELADSPLGPLDGLGNLVDILGLDDGLEVVFEDLGEVVCEGSAGISHAHDSRDALWSSDPRKCFRISSQSGGLS